MKTDKQKEVTPEVEQKVKKYSSDLHDTLIALGKGEPVSDEPGEPLWACEKPTGPLEDGTDEYLEILHARWTPEYIRKCRIWDWAHKILDKLGGGHWSSDARRQFANAVAEEDREAIVRELKRHGYGLADAKEGAGVLLDGAREKFPLVVEHLDDGEVLEEPLPKFADGITGSIADYARAIEPDFPLEFKIASVMTRVGLALSGKTVLDGAENLQPRFYMELVAPANGGKTGSMETTDGLDDHVIFYQTLFSVDSGPALLDAFVAESTRQKRDGVDDGTGPSRLLLTVDEIKHLFEVSRSGDTKGSNILTHLLRLYENNKTGNATRQHGNQQVMNAHVAVLGSATPQGHDEMWVGTSGSKNGLQSRFCVVGTNVKSLPTHRRKSNVAAAEKALSRLRNQLGQPPAVLHMTSQAAQMLTKWAEKIASNKHSIRLSDIVKRVTMVLAVTNDTSTVGPTLMAQAIAFGDHVLAARERYNPDDAANNEQAFENRILATLRKHRPMTKRDTGRLIGPQNYKGGYKSFNDAWVALMNAGAIEQATKIGRKVYFKAV